MGGQLEKFNRMELIKEENKTVGPSLFKGLGREGDILEMMALQ